MVDAVASQPDLVLHILASLSDRGLALACETCRLWRQLGRSNELWRPRAIRRFPELKGLVGPNVDCFALHARHTVAQLSPFSTPPLPPLQREGLSFLCRIERAHKFNGKLSFRPVAAATLRATTSLLGSATRKHMSFEWPVAVKPSALSRLPTAEAIVQEQDCDGLVESIEADGKWVSSLSVHRARDGKMCSLMVRQPLITDREDACGRLPGNGPEHAPAVYFEPVVSEDLDLGLVVRIEPSWPEVDGQPQPEQPRWRLGVAFVRASQMQIWSSDDDDSDDEFRWNVASGAVESRRTLTAQRCLRELARLHWV